jgi:hypothetical protein
MKIANMKQRDAVEPLWQHLAVDVIVPNLDVLGILEAAPVQSQQLERCSNDRVHRIPVFNVKRVGPLSEDLSFVICLDP